MYGGIYNVLTGNIYKLVVQGWVYMAVVCVFNIYWDGGTSMEMGMVGLLCK